MSIDLDIPKSTSVVTPPTAYPVSLDRVREWVRMTDDADQWRVEEMLKSAIARIEKDNATALMSQTLRMKLDEFPSEIRLDVWPVQSISSITYVDTDGTTQTLSASLYTSDLSGSPARIVPAYGQSWPSTRYQPAAVTVNYIAGYASASVVPAQYLQCIRYLVEMEADKHSNFDEIYTVLRRGVAWRP